MFSRRRKQETVDISPRKKENPETQGIRTMTAAEEEAAGDLLELEEHLRIYTDHPRRELMEHLFLARIDEESSGNNDLEISTDTAVSSRPWLINLEDSIYHVEK